MRVFVVIAAGLAVLAGCTGHKYEPREPGISISGEAGIGVKYEGGKTTPVNKTKIRIHLGGSL
ncbi:hypothetical protein [Aliiroseovarius sp. 2305UL8-7]|uniref:hypothetical protein n=1 Tax=Aliiroseovarius conchicola TaxID=3121637 RepID=UPI0035288E40